MRSKLESDVCCRLQVAPSGESYEGKRRPGRKQRQTTAGYMACCQGKSSGRWPTSATAYAGSAHSREYITQWARMGAWWHQTLMTSPSTVLSSRCPKQRSTNSIQLSTQTMYSAASGNLAITFHTYMYSRPVVKVI